MKEPMFCMKLVTYSLKTYITNVNRDDGSVHVFHMLSTTRAKLCRVVLTRNVQSGSYHLLLDEEMVPNVGKHFLGIFLFVHNNGIAHKA